MTAPAFVHGSDENALVRFIEDSRGDLVDLEFYCGPCALASFETDLDNAQRWPAFDFAADYITRCNRCGAIINVPAALDNPEDTD